MVDVLIDAGRAAIIRRNAAEDPLYTPQQWDQARAAYRADTGMDPMVNGTRYGDDRGRWWYHAPWKWARPWLPRAARGSDEWCNPTVWIVLPFMLGVVVVRYKRHIRDRFDGSCDRCIAEAGHPNCPLCAYEHWPTCVPVRVVCERCGRRFGEEGDTGRFATFDGPHTRSGFLYCSAKCADHTTASLV